MDTNDNEVVKTALSNPLIVRTVFDCLNTKELLVVSLVNKCWNYEARCLLRDKWKCVAVINGYRPCVRAKKLNGMLGSLNVNFFNGLSIIIGGHKGGVSPVRKSVEDIYENLVNFPWKYLEFRWSMCMTEECLLGQFILRLMSRSLTLEQLIINDIPRRMELKEQNRHVGELGLPKLKILQIPEGSFPSFRLELLLGLLSRAPKVQELWNIVEPQWIPYIPLDKLKIVKKLRIPYFYGDLFTDHEIRALEIFRASEPKLSTLIAYQPVFPPVNNIRMMGDYFDCLASILYSSSETLREVKIDSYSMYKLGFVLRGKLVPPVLKKVERLTFEMRRRQDFVISRHLLRVPLAKIFPEVTTVTLVATYPNNDNNGEDHEVEQDEIYPWPAVKKVTFENLRWCDQRVADLGVLFPNLCFLEVTWNEMSESYIPFRQIWSSLPFLEKLVVHGQLETRWKTNFDAEFCGIYPEEAALLRGENDEFLKAVNIVPPFAPITHMKALKIIQLEVETYSVFSSKANDFFLSKVAGLVALRRMPNLELRLRAPFEAADQLDQLRPFVKLDFLPPNPNRRTRRDVHQFGAVVFHAFLAESDEEM